MGVKSHARAAPPDSREISWDLCRGHGKGSHRRPTGQWRASL